MDLSKSYFSTEPTKPISYETQTIYDMLISQGYEAKIMIRRNWGEVVYFEHEGILLFCSGYHYEEDRSLEIWYERQDYSVYNYVDDDLNLHPDFSIPSQGYWDEYYYEDSSYMGYI